MACVGGGGGGLGWVSGRVRCRAWRGSGLGVGRAGRADSIGMLWTRATGVAGRALRRVSAVGEDGGARTGTQGVLNDMLRHRQRMYASWSEHQFRQQCSLTV